MINFTRFKNPMPEQNAQERRNNFNESQTGYTEDMAIAEAMRCLKCRTHPCMTVGCPVHNRIPDFIDKISVGKFEEAYQILRETTCLPAVCGRVCPQEEQCEGNCVRGIKGEAVSIGALERFVADWHREHVQDTSTNKPENNGKKVAIVGSGPAGLAAAKDLSDLGYNVTIFEKTNVVGGILTYGIPEFRLPKAIVENEINMLKAKGVEFKTNTAVGDSLNIDDFQEKLGFDAVFLGFGAGIGTTMHIPGEDIKGVYQANDYLIKVNLEKAYDPNSANPLPKYDTIAVVGGGNVAMDACRSAIRTGAKKVYIIYRRSEAEMPAHLGEIKEARDEGVEFIFLTNPIAIKADASGKLYALECVKTKLGEDDSRGRRRPVDIPNSNHDILVDCVIMAVGTVNDQSLVKQIDLNYDAKYRLIVDPVTMQTSKNGVYAGGDVVTGPLTVIRAMGAGKQAASAIHNYLSNK
ncbi:MAG: NADPH-dependent glutamate synthase [Succinivibrionaceae bacterium]